MVDAIVGAPAGRVADGAGGGASAGGGAARTGGARFGEALARSAGDGLTFSGHAAKRIEQRGLGLDDDQMRRLQTAVDRAETKGSRDSLILLDDLALVVSITNRTVVTAVDEASQKERVFTNIDSVVIAE